MSRAARAQPRGAEAGGGGVGRRADLRHRQRRRRGRQRRRRARRRARGWGGWAGTARLRRRRGRRAAMPTATRTSGSAPLDDCAPEAAGAAGSAGLVPLCAPLARRPARGRLRVVGVVLVGQFGRIAVVDQAAAARDVGVAHEGVAVERQLVEHLARAQQAGAGVDHADGVDADFLPVLGRPAAPARRRCRRAARARRGCRTSRTAAAPGTGRARGPTRPSVWPRSSDLRSRPSLVAGSKMPAMPIMVLVEHAQRHRAGVGRLALQQLVDGRPGVREVAEEVVHAGAHRRRQHGVVGLGDRLQRVVVERVVEREDLAVDASRTDPWGRRCAGRC